MKAIRGFVVAGAVVQGTRHLASGRGCQDAFKSAVTAEGEAVVLAVADGAGSRDRSSLGAHLAVDLACRVLGEGVPEVSQGAAAWTEWVSGRGGETVEGWRRAGAAVLNSGEGQGSSPELGALASTLVAAVVRPPWAAFLSVGDCIAAVLTRDTQAAAPAERCHLVVPPPAPEGGTVFLSSPGAALRVRTFALWDPELSGVVLASDGVVPLALDHPAVRGLPAAAGPLPSRRFFCGAAAALRANGGDAEPLRALLSGPDAARSGDDLTVVCALTGGG
ncbi:protein phosphatase 2C domain-containing protein [Streptomyces sp. NPDC048483]|uniref:protein phosphatase 2C domain-containing protein n=1 Tax=Streptomyces sp. NPDC048483 TaxID=3154927 RepID=UPI00343525C8